jgi:hypothetical protein
MFVAQLEGHGVEVLFEQEAIILGVHFSVHLCAKINGAITDNIHGSQCRAIPICTDAGQSNFQTKV